MDLIQKHLMAGSFFETAELSYLQSIVRPHSVIVEAGANIGNHLVYYGLFMNPSKIIPIEPNQAAIDLLRRNITLNQISCVDTSLLGFGIGETYGHSVLLVQDRYNIGAARLVESRKGSVEVYALDEKLDTKIDFIKIDVEGMEMKALRGASRLLRASQPIMFIEILNANLKVFCHWLVTNNYKIIKTFDYVNAKNVIAVPGYGDRLDSNSEAVTVNKLTKTNKSRLKMT